MLRNKLANIWRKKGLLQGDTVLIHSSIKRTLMQYRRDKFEYSFMDDLFNSFFDAVGNNGTILFPLFNFDFCQGVPFHYHETKSHMGPLSEFSRRHKNAYRTNHPVYSFAIFGKEVEEFKCLKNISAYGKDSPFEILKQIDGKIASLDLEDQNSMTFYHHVEELLKVEYRYYKDFSGEYTDSKGITESKTFNIYVRDLDRQVLTYVNPMSEILWKKGIYTGDKPNIGSGFRIAKARDIFEATSDIISSNSAENILFRYNK